MRRKGSHVPKIFVNISKLFTIKGGNNRKIHEDYEGNENHCCFYGESVMEFLEIKQGNKTKYYGC
jgi:hypothetical protein